MNQPLVTYPSAEELSAANGRMREIGTATFPLPGLNALVLPVVEGVKRLIASPDAPNWKLKVQRVECDGSPDDGLIRTSHQMMRLPDELTQKPPDDKWKYQYRPTLLAELRKRDLGASAVRHQQFLRDSHTLYLACLELTKRHMRALDDVLPGHHFAERHAAALVHNLDLLRVLYYDAKLPGKSLGKEHLDKAFQTYHLADNDPGLHLGNALDPYIAEPDRVLSFYGEKAERVTDGLLKAMPHHILSHRSSIEDGVCRWAAIYFTHTY